MKRRVMLIGVALLVLGGLGLYWSRTKEPSYQGKTLMEWKAEFRRTRISVEDAAGMQPSAIPSYYAIRHIGSNAFPFLLQELRVRDSPLKNRFITFIDGNHKHINIQSAFDRHMDALSVFRILRDLAQPVVPDLIQLTKDRDADVRLDAFRTLTNLNLPLERILPVMLSLLKDPNEWVRVNVANILASDYKAEAKKAELFKLFPGRYDDLTNNVSTNASVAK